LFANYGMKYEIVQHSGPQTPASAWYLSSCNAIWAPQQCEAFIRVAGRQIPCRIALLGSSLLQKDE
ncbi:MAG: hypothetical protein IJ092_06065, partial [Atopobiaceae bacterium]|nr:hypothetical protein [Atopobiaceae bacterium]